jgi:hypothetical protein
MWEAWVRDAPFEVTFVTDAGGASEAIIGSLERSLGVSAGMFMLAECSGAKEGLPCKTRAAFEHMWRVGVGGVGGGMGGGAGSFEHGGNASVVRSAGGGQGAVEWAVRVMDDTLVFPEAMLSALKEAPTHTPM